MLAAAGYARQHTWPQVVRDRGALTARERSVLLEPRTRTMVGKGRRVLRFGGPRPVVAAAWREHAISWLAGYDLLLTPAVATTPGPAGALNGRGYLSTYLAAAKAEPFCQVWNLVGLPALVVPVGVRDGATAAGAAGGCR